MIYNAKAGNASSLTPDEIQNALRQAGYDLVYFPTSEESDLDEALSHVRDLVVVAGGDGKIQAVVTRLLNRNIRIVPLPLGMADNISHMLALRGKPLEMISGLADPVERHIDILKKKNLSCWMFPNLIFK